MPEPRLTKAEYQKVVADTIAMLLQNNTLVPVEQSAPGYLGEVLDALKPLQALRPPYGEVPDADARRFKYIQDALRRPDLSKALRPEPAECVYLTVNVFKRGRQG